MINRRVVMIMTVLVLMVSVLATTAFAVPLLRIGSHADEGTLNPYTYVRGVPGYYMLLFVYDTLFYYDADNNMIPWLVDTFNWDDDGLAVSLTLHNNVTWHDGVPFTTDDVVFSFEYVGDYFHSRWTAPVQNIASIDVKGPHEMVIHLKETSVGFMYQPLADQPMIPRHIWENVDDPRAFDGRIGTGPYKLEDYQAGQFYRFRANPDYFKGKPKVDEIVMPIISDTTALFTALKAGSISGVTRDIPPELVNEFTGISNMKIVSGANLVTLFMLFNNQIEPFDNVEFRRAITYSIDNQEMADILLLGNATLGSPGFVHPALPWFNEELADTHQYDPALAAEMLDNLGFKDQSGNGYREYPDGRRLELSILSPSDDPLRIRGAEIISDFLKQVGLRAPVSVMERATLFSRIGWGATADDHDFSKPRNFQLLMWGWSAPIQSWPGRMLDVFHSDNEFIGRLNLQGSGNSELDYYLEQISLTIDEAQRTEFIKKAQKLIAEENSFVPMYHPDGIYVYNERDYDGWVFMPGHGILNKLSFLEN